MSQIRLLTYKQVGRWVHKTIDQQPSIVVPLLLGGDRLACCDEAVAVTTWGRIRGVATISPSGEDYSGYPAIVGVYVLPTRRQRGYGQQLMEAALRRCQERGFIQVRIDVTSARLMRIIERLPDDLWAMLDIHDHGDPMGRFQEQR